MTLNSHRSECESVIELLSPYLDGRVSDAEKESLEEHVSRCSSCALELQRLRVVVQALRALPVVPVPRSFALPEGQKGPSTILPYLQRATFALAAVFIMMFVTSLYIQATAPQPRAQFSAAVRAQKAESPKVLGGTAASEGSSSEMAGREAKGEPLPSGAGAASPAAPAGNAPSDAPQPGGSPIAAQSAPAAAAARSPALSQTPGGGGEGNLGTDSVEKKVEGGPEGALSLRSVEPKDHATQEEGGGYAVQLEQARDRGEPGWPMLEVEIGVLALLLIVGAATLFLRKKERANI